MPIYFSCSKCNKAMFAQDQYAGRGVACPDCKERNLIPSPAVPMAGMAEVATRTSQEESAVPNVERSPEPAFGRDAHLIDMERGPVPSAPITMPAANPVAQTAPVTLTAAPSTSLTPTTPAAVDGGATRRCPVCAETIKSAAKKCRFCNSILDDDLRSAEEQKQKEMVIGRVLYLAQRSAALWRGLSVVMTGMVGGAMLLLTLNAMQLNAPAMLIIFDVMLMIGLLWSMLQMKDGPAQVFVSAALAVALCVPLNMLMGFPVEDLLAKMAAQNPRMKEVNADQLRTALAVFGFCGGMILAIPLWVAALKVAAAQRLKTMLGIKS